MNKKRLLKRIIAFLILVIAISYLSLPISLILIFIYALIFTNPYEILILGFLLDGVKIIPHNEYAFWLPITITTGVIILFISLIKPIIRTNEFLEK